jgi:uncharacterized SAM-binding protein YcdF (DUF218 family)
MYPQLLRAMARWLDVGARPQRADYVMVLNGGEETRPFVAAALVNAGFARRVLVAGTALSPHMEDRIVPPDHEINKRVLMQRGVAESDITILPGAAATTFDEATALAAFLVKRPRARVIVITNDYHSRRSRWIFARTLADRAEQVMLVSAPTDEFRLDSWWQDDEGFVTIGSEYLKLGFYVVRYGHFGYWLVACIVLVLVGRWIRRRETPSPMPA